MLDTFPLERITYTQKGKQEEFEEVLLSFYSFVKNVKLVDEENQYM